MSDKTENTEVEETEDNLEVEETEEESDAYESDETEVEDQTENKVDRAELNKVIKQRQDLKRRLRDAEKKAEELARANETDSEKARREAAEEASQKVVERYKPALVKKHVEARLLEAGVAPAKMNRLIKLMDMDEIDVDDDLNVDGVDDEVDRLQEEFPELFAKLQNEAVEEDEKPRRKRTPAPKVESSDRAPATKKKTTTELLFEGLRGSRG